MTFDWPVMLIFLLLVPLALVFYAKLQARRRQIAERYGSLGFGQGPAGRRPGLTRHIPPALFLVGLTILIISLARPQMEVELPRIEGTVMLVFDVSGSMAADDLQPTRMEAAKAAAQEFVLRQPASVQVGIVAFSDGGLTIQAPTNNQDAILASIARLKPQRGTSLGHGMLTGLQAIATDLGYDLRLNENETPPGEGEPAPTQEPVEIPEGALASSAIILLSDGENNAAPDPLEVAQLANELGVRIYTVGIGSAAGTIIEVDGFSVHTMLNEEMLRGVAQISEGEYFNAGSEQELQAIYENIKPQFVVKPEEMEVTSLFAGASILILMAGGLFSLLWFSRVP